jgi:hypothetical protein
MADNLRQAYIKIKENEQLLEKLRRFEKSRGLLQRLRKDDVGREYLEAQYNGKIYTFYLGVERVFPSDMAHSFVRSSRVSLDEPCQECYDSKTKRSLGRTAAGKCPTCKGLKVILVPEEASIFEITREYDPMLVDPAQVTASVKPEIAAVAE